LSARKAARREALRPLAIENRWAAEQPITMAHLLEHTAGFGSIIINLYRLVFAAAACCATSYLMAYGIIGLRLWSY
jgi:CubicO group peptidase (beta-lactamase class C family)